MAVVIIYLWWRLYSNLESLQPISDLDALTTGHNALTTGDIFMGFYDPFKKPKSPWLAGLFSYAVPLVLYKIRISHCGVIYRADNGKLWMASLDAGYPGVPNMPQDYKVQFEPLSKYVAPNESGKVLYKNIVFAKSKKIMSNEEFTRRFERMKHILLDPDIGSVCSRPFKFSKRCDERAYTCSEWANEFVSGEYEFGVLPDKWVDETKYNWPARRLL